MNEYESALYEAVRVLKLIDELRAEIRSGIAAG